VAHRAVRDPSTFLETSSYGPAAIAAIERTVGGAVLVHGSDLPYAAPALPEPRLREALMVANPRRLLGNSRG
jgi:6-methylsalicylate decarboxylase